MQGLSEEASYKSKSNPSPEPSLLALDLGCSATITVSNIKL